MFFDTLDMGEGINHTPVPTRVQGRLSGRWVGILFYTVLSFFRRSGPSGGYTGRSIHILSFFQTARYTCAAEHYLHKPVSKSVFFR